MSDTVPADRAADTQMASEFERLRPYLLRVAYSHLGTLGEAEDVIQEAWLRLVDVDREQIRDLRAWLTTVVSRIALDVLTSARARRERYVGPWLPEPLIDAGPVSADPAGRAELDESVSMALLIVLESLSPAERGAFLLHDVFGYSFPEVAQIVGRTPQATRQLAARARNAVEARRPRYPATGEQQREVVGAFLAATQNGDIATLLELVDPDVTLRGDGGGLVPAARKVLTGAGRVARVLTSVFAKLYASPRARVRASSVLINGAPGLLLDTHRGPTVFSFTLDRGRIIEIDAIRNPDKLGTLAGTPLSAPSRRRQNRPANPLPQRRSSRRRPTARHGPARRGRDLHPWPHVHIRPARRQPHFAPIGGRSPS